MDLAIGKRRIQHQRDSQILSIIGEGDPLAMISQPEETFFRFSDFDGETYSDFAEEQKLLITKLDMRIEDPLSRDP
jgi:hypothetical protein